MNFRSPPIQGSTEDKIVLVQWVVLVEDVQDNEVDEEQALLPAVASQKSLKLIGESITGFSSVSRNDLFIESFIYSHHYSIRNYF